jgi:DNA modification methylase
MSSLQTFAARLRSVTDASLASPKRDAAKPAGVENWYRYYAGFSPSFARSVLTHAGLRSTSVILDPWNGSGTTTYTAASLGFPSLGLDISPIANLVASAKIAHRGDLAHSDGLTSQLIANARDRRSSADEIESHPLRRWLHPTDVAAFLSVYRSILDLLARPHQDEPNDPLISPPPPLAAFFLLCVLRAARKHAGVRQSTNPTWIRPPKRRQRLRDSARDGYQSLTSTFRATVTALTIPFSNAPPLTGDPGHSSIVAGDARVLPFVDRSVDFVLTSPPYCTRLDYPISASFELAALGMDPDVSLRDLRYASMGTPLIRRTPPPATKWPASIQRLLQRIEAHDSKNSDTYYLATYRQYFSDANQSLRELRRVLRPGAKAVMVLQTSFYKELSIPLPDLFMHLARPLGFDATTINRFPVQRVLTTINPTSQRHLADRQYVETVIALEAA